MMKLKTNKNGFIIIDVMLGTAIFSILMLSFISLYSTYEKSRIENIKIKEINYYSSCIIKELKSNNNETYMNSLLDKNNYINVNYINNFAVEDQPLINIFEGNIVDLKKYINVLVKKDSSIYSYEIFYVNKYYGDKFNYTIKGKL
ncbi:hypothetical protein [Inconstantimicrobium mannanitabidum]|uniref:Uncharacterized protein n=1 Tax=Inconstantimicrobium mannanitabidum TaxID=1604901 RepID=A0ACB5RAR7_9CLOT|nr:hypothetical protein [Clostridium sp. TW13]GKX66137.1 hypothetical protein rsdtw13_13950 [Clostridium sp. TW13]